MGSFQKLILHNKKIAVSITESKFSTSVHSSSQQMGIKSKTEGWDER